jgi:hypothetical protein
MLTSNPSRSFIPGTSRCSANGQLTQAQSPFLIFSHLLECPGASVLPSSLSITAFHLQGSPDAIACPAAVSILHTLLELTGTPNPYDT